MYLVLYEKLIYTGKKSNFIFSTKLHFYFCILIFLKKGTISRQVGKRKTRNRDKTSKDNEREDQRKRRKEYERTTRNIEKSTR